MTPRDLAPVGMRCEPGIHTCYWPHPPQVILLWIAFKQKSREVRIYTERNTHGST